MEYSTGDRVVVYIPRAADPDHRYHGEKGRVVDVLADDLSQAFDSPDRGYIYTVEFDSSGLESADFRFSDIQPIEDN
jgi:ribosomal protein L21E